MKKIILALGAFLLAAGLIILGRDGRQLKRVEAKIDNELATKTKAGLVKAEKLKKKADKHSSNAKLAAERTHAALEARGEKDQDMDALLSDWQSKRMR